MLIDEILSYIGTTIELQTQSAPYSTVLMFNRIATQRASLPQNDWSSDSDPRLIERHINLDHLQKIIFW